MFIFCTQFAYLEQYSKNGLDEASPTFERSGASSEVTFSARSVDRDVVRSEEKRSECDLLSEAGQSTIDGLAITINRELVHNHPSQRTLQRHTLVLIGSRDGVGRTRKKNRITNLDGTVICAKKHDCPTESSLLLSADLFRRICREAIRAGIRSRHRLHLNRPALSLDGSSTYTCSCATRILVAVPTAQQYAVAYPSMSDPIGDRG
uniref:Uncharacterized protein n=1 Tax=Haemonchus contortus TaxID=6289 RepID=W6ND00_HAECO